MSQARGWGGGVRRRCWRLPLAARCPLHGRRPVHFLVLQDLRPLGFQPAQRRRGLGLRHCLLALRTLASFHASSVALMASDPHVADGLGNPMITEGPNSMEPFVHACLQQAADACRSWEGFAAYAGALEALKGSLVQKLAALNQPSPGEFRVILHGDFWTNNLLLRYEEALPVDVRMVDFQLSRVASPAVDLLHFPSTSPSERVSACHEALRAALQLLGAEVAAPPLGALLAAVRAHGACALLGAAGVLPLVKATRDAGVDVDAAVGGSAAAGDLYQEPAVRRWLQRVLPEYKEKGWLDA
ncbi:hypothetical protein R5R35_002282 [Gryllus longicercus]|uniref:CHK kinase-like domain-containing protein n=1 Tax=Gryllus longicercus TaxID=2509291 RepID=A0AAN9ZCE5_9ORTH